jgi:hypothetical protein
MPLFISSEALAVFRIEATLWAGRRESALKVGRYQLTLPRFILQGGAHRAESNLSRG